MDQTGRDLQQDHSDGHGCKGLGIPLDWEGMAPSLGSLGVWAGAVPLHTIKMGGNWRDSGGL